MENIIKSPADGTIKKINAITGIAVEKNQLLIQFLPWATIEEILLKRVL